MPDKSEYSSRLEKIATLIGEAPSLDELMNIPDAINRPGLDMISHAAELRRIAEDLSCTTRKVVVVGSFNSGKSTLINALVQANILPTGPIPTTATAIRLRSGAGPSLSVTYQSGEVEYVNIAIADLADVDVGRTRIEAIHQALEKYVIGVADEKPIREISVTVNHDTLALDTELVDTPGVGESNARVSIAVRLLPSADAVVIVFDATQPATSAEKQLLRLLAASGLSNIVAAINRIDLLQQAGAKALVVDMMSKLLLPVIQAHNQTQVSDPSFRSIQRLHTTDARSALEACEPSLQDDRVYTQSGVAGLRESLVSILGRGEKGRAKHELLVPMLSDTFHQARALATQRVEILSDTASRPDTSTRIKESQEWLEGVKRFIMLMESTVKNSAQTFALLIYDSLGECIASMHNTWPAEVDRLDIEEILDSNIIQERHLPKYKAKLANALTECLQNYVELKFVGWAKTLPGVLEPSFRGLQDSLSAYQHLFGVELYSLSAGAGKTSPGQAPMFQDSLLKNRLGQLISEEQIGKIADGVVDRIFRSLADNRLVTDASLGIARSLLEIGSAVLISARHLPGAFISLVGTQLLDQIRSTRHPGTDTGSENEQIGKVFGHLGSNAVDRLHAALKKLLVEETSKTLFGRLTDFVRSEKDTLIAAVENEFSAWSSGLRAELDRQRDHALDTVERLAKLGAAGERVAQVERERTKHVLEVLEAEIETLCSLVAERPIRMADVSATVATYRDYAGAASPDALDHIRNSVRSAFDTETVLAPRREVLLQTSQSLHESTLKEGIDRSVASLIGISAEQIQSTNSRTLQLLSPKLAGMIGLAQVKQRVADLMDYLKYTQRRDTQMDKPTAVPKLHMVFYGNPGTGKTTVAQEVGRLYRKMGLLKKGHVVPVTRKDLVGGFIGHTEMKASEAVERALDGVLFIDEAHTLYTNDDSKDFGRRVIEAVNFVTGHERYESRLAVILAGYADGIDRLLSFDQGLRSRFPEINRFKFEDYTPTELMSILVFDLRSRYFMELSESAREQIFEIIEQMYRNRDEAFGNARDMRNLAEALAFARGVRGERENLSWTAPVDIRDIPPNYRYMPSKGAEPRGRAPKSRNREPTAAPSNAGNADAVQAPANPHEDDDTLRRVTAGQLNIPSSKIPVKRHAPPSADIYL